jgi:hypothetical protein
VKNFIQTVKPTNCGSLTPPRIAPGPPANTPAGKVYRAYTATAIWGPFAKVVLSSYVWWLGNYRFYYRWYLNVRQNLITVPYCHPQRRLYRVLEDQNRRFSKSQTLKLGFCRFPWSSVNHYFPYSKCHFAGILTILKYPNSILSSLKHTSITVEEAKPGAGLSQGHSQTTPPQWAAVHIRPGAAANLVGSGAVIAHQGKNFGRAGCMLYDVISM